MEQTLVQTPTANPTIIEGYAVVWGDSAKIGNIVTEVIGKDSFTYDDVVALCSHDRASVPLGRTGAGTVSLKSDDYGIYASISVDPSRKDIISAATRGDFAGWSFDLIDPVYSWKGTTGTITKNKISEITLTPWPSYKKTTIKVTKK